MPYGGGMYRGDIYRGGFFGDVGRVLGGAAKGFITGGPIGAITGGIASIKKPSAPAGAQPFVPGVAGALGGLAGRVLGGAVRQAPGVLIGAGVGKLGQLLFGPDGRPIKRRRMNPLNPRALTRATRRLHSFHSKSRKALRQLGYTVVRTGTARGARKKRR